MRIGILAAFVTFIGKKQGQCIMEIMAAQGAYKIELKAKKCPLGLQNLMRQNAKFQNGMIGFLIITTANIITIITAICRVSRILTRFKSVFVLSCYKILPLSPLRTPTR